MNPCTISQYKTSSQAIKSASNKKRFAIYRVMFQLMRRSDTSENNQWCYAGNNKKNKSYKSPNVPKLIPQSTHNNDYTNIIIIKIRYNMQLVLQNCDSQLVGQRAQAKA